MKLLRVLFNLSFIFCFPFLVFLAGLREPKELWEALIESDLWQDWGK